MNHNIIYYLLERYVPASSIKYRLICKDADTILKRKYNKSIIKIQRWYRYHRAPRFDEEGEVTENTLKRIYMTQYPEDSIEDFCKLASRKIPDIKKITFLNLSWNIMDEEFTLIHLEHVLKICNKKELLYIGW